MYITEKLVSPKLGFNLPWHSSLLGHISVSAHIIFLLQPNKLQKYPNQMEQHLHSKCIGDRAWNPLYKNETIWSKGELQPIPIIIDSLKQVQEIGLKREARRGKICVKSRWYSDYHSCLYLAQWKLIHDDMQCCHKLPKTKWNWPQVKTTLCTLTHEAAFNDLL